MNKNAGGAQCRGGKEGEWLSDLKDGQGVLKYADGHIYDGTWKMVRAQYEQV